MPRIVSGICVILCRYLCTQWIMTYIFTKPFFDALYQSYPAEQNWLSGNHVAGIYPRWHASLCASRSSLLLSYQDPLQWWQESSPLLPSKHCGFSVSSKWLPCIEPNKLFPLHKCALVFVPLPSINDPLNNIFSWKQGTSEFDLRQIIFFT